MNENLSLSEIILEYSEKINHLSDSDLKRLESNLKNALEYVESVIERRESGKDEVLELCELLGLLEVTVYG